MVRINLKVMVIFSFGVRVSYMISVMVIVMF